MKDIAVVLEDRPGALADLGAALGGAGVSVEGGGAWVVNGRGVAHLLVADARGARRALEDAGITVAAEREVVFVRLDQERPGQLGAIARALATAGVNIEVFYSDHDHRLVLVVDDLEAARAVALAWPDPASGLP